MDERLDHGLIERRKGEKHSDVHSDLCPDPDNVNTDVLTFDNSVLSFK